MSFGISWVIAKKYFVFLIYFSSLISNSLIFMWKSTIKPRQRIIYSRRGEEVDLRRYRKTINQIPTSDDYRRSCPAIDSRFTTNLRAKIERLSMKNSRQYNVNPKLGKDKDDRGKRLIASSVRLAPQMETKSACR